MLAPLYSPSWLIKSTCFSCNKNKTGFSDGDYMGANIIEDSPYDNNVENCGDVTDVMDIAISEQDLYQNCSHNSSNDSGKVQNSVCDTVYTNGIHTDVFGFIPKGPLKLYDGNPTTCNCISDIIRAHLMIKDSGIPNYIGCRIPVASNLKCHIWSQNLQNYWDKQLPDLLQFGFPLDFNRTVQLNSTEQNHKSALENSSHVEKYIAELQHGAILGPFDGKPIHLHTSPLMVRDKQDSDSKRTIMDLSWPKGNSINCGVCKDVYLDTEFRAFRQIKVDPGDIDLLGFKNENKYFLDFSVAFGYRNGSQIFQRCTDAIRFIMSQHGFHHLHDYIYDLIYTGLPSEIHASYNFLQHLLSQLGLDISIKKLVPPSTSVTCLGIQIDTIKRTISIPPGKLQDIVDL